MRRFLPLSGVALVAFVVAAVLLAGGSPSNTASGAEVADYYDAHQVRMFVASLLFAAAALFAVTFAAAVGRALGSVEPAWERVLHGGGVVFATALGLVGALTFALADSPTKISEQSLQALNLLQSDLWIFWNAAMGIFMLGAAACWLASPRGQRRLAWVALVLGVALFFPFADFFAFLASGLWIVVASLVLFGGERAPAYRPAARAA